MAIQLTKEQLINIDQAIDVGLPSEILKDFVRDEMIEHFFCAYPEMFVSQMQVMEVGEYIDKYRDAASICLLWIWQYCSDSVPKGQTLKMPLIDSCRDLFRLSLTYSGMVDAMNILWTGLQTITQVDDKSIEMRFNDDEQLELDYTDQAVFAASADGRISEKCTQRLYRSLNIRIIDNFSFSFQPKGWVLNMLREELNQVLPWEISTPWQFQGYTFEEFRKVWNELATLSLLHTTSCAIVYSTQKNFPYSSALLIKKKCEWLRLLAENCQIKHETALAIFSHLTFNLQLCTEKSRKKVDPLYVPFIPLSGDKYLLNTQGVVGSNPERNFLDLQNCIDSANFDKFTNCLENDWKNKIIPRIESLGYICSSIQTGNGNIDLLILDVKNKVGLAVELKYLLAIDRVKRKDIDAIEKGISQATRSANWLKEMKKPCRLSDTEISEEWTFSGLVLSKNHSLLAFVNLQTTPVISENVFFKMIESKKFSLSRTWSAARDVTYRARLGKHIEKIAVERKFGDATIRSIGLKTIKPWTLEDVV